MILNDLPSGGSVLLVQPLPGIGDMIWHLPHLRAIGKAASGARLTLATKPRSAADQLLAGETLFDAFLWLDRNPDRGRGRHDGPAGFTRLLRALRAGRFDAAVLLHHSATLAAMLALAGIPARYGYGFGAQRALLNHGPFLPEADLRLHPYDQASAWTARAGLTLDDPEPRIVIRAAEREAARARLGFPGRFAVLGIGSSEPAKQWGAARFAALSRAMFDEGWDGVVLAGGPAEAALAGEVRASLGPASARAVPAIGWPLREIAAALAACDVYVGNDTGIMNLAAATGAPSIGLFGATPPFSHASRIIPVLPPDGRPHPDGMARITVDAAMRAVRGAGSRLDSFRPFT